MKNRYIDLCPIIELVWYKESEAFDTTRLVADLRHHDLDLMLESEIQIRAQCRRNYLFSLQPVCKDHVLRTMKGRGWREGKGMRGSHKESSLPGPLAFFPWKKKNPESHRFPLGQWRCRACLLLSHPQQGVVFFSLDFRIMKSSLLR